MNETKRAKYQSILEKEKEELVQQIAALAADKTRKKGALSPDSGEQAQETENDQVVDGLETLEMEKLTNVTNALGRLKAGTFGVCMECEEEISESRLDAVPYANKCISCS